MQLIDWIIILIYLFGTMALGLLLSHQETKTDDEDDKPTSIVYNFIAGRNLPWWLAGTSMAATTFSIDTPLYICGVVATRGIAGNWEWWSFGIAHIVLIYVFAGLWRRSEMVTDAELTELRYGGRTAAILRATKAFLFAVPINCIGIGYAMLAMVKVVDALQLWQSLGFDPGEATKLWTVIALSVFVLIYTGVSGLWGVVVTDFFQFFLGLFGAMLVAVIAVNDAGGMRELIPNVQQITDFDVLSFIPITNNGGLNFTWNDAAGITATTFSAYIFVQWWSFRRSDGGGEFVQRLLAVKGETDEAAKKEAEKATWFFNILHYIVRTWPWIITALAAMVLLPNLEDAELAYPTLMLNYLPSVVLGLVVASLIAAFMSTISTSINWGASYLTNDLYRRFFRPDATDQELTDAVRLASLLVTVLGSIAAFYATDVRTVFRLVIAIGTGPGLVLILRWFWWRINAAAELSAMVTGFLIGLVTTINPAINNIFPDFGWRLLGISVLTALVWITVMYLTPPEDEQTLLNFYEKVRPGGIGWQYQQYKSGLEPAQNLQNDLLKVVAATLVMFGSMFAIGGFLLLQSITGFVSLTIAIIGGFWLRKLSKKRTLPMQDPEFHDVY
ncbi:MULTISPECIES: sodium:solute symporter family protein [Crocosphaera]|uniref:Sodium-solute symporter, putative n=2 Tax=Crocosphaera watsonii TaxID=263511 RepID=T2JZB1_CROWT|nr:MULTISPECIES: sodium:solute symporter family protein [Crocosphaera]MCH2247507.1 Na+:solute symporter [Crocosphaera sp.]NQZ63393.1 Na+:solute symporter [Crocosphaera sp.]CCQ70376.1 sodium-solute symporter, putative [Crocosphaera watsonii WH 0402]